MKMLYKELDEMAGQLKDEFVMILSYHGMKSIGMFGDHSDYGFWSLNKKTEISNPKISDFYTYILEKYHN